MKEIAVLCVLALSVGVGAGAAARRATNCFNDVTGTNSVSVYKDLSGKELGSSYDVDCNLTGDGCEWYTSTDVRKWNGNAYVSIANSPFKRDASALTCGSSSVDWKGDEKFAVAAGTYQVKSKLFKGTIAQGSTTQIASDEDHNIIVP